MFANSTNTFINGGDLNNHLTLTYILPAISNAANTILKICFTRVLMLIILAQYTNNFESENNLTKILAKNLGKP